MVLVLPLALQWCMERGREGVSAREQAAACASSDCRCCRAAASCAAAAASRACRSATPASALALTPASSSAKPSCWPFSPAAGCKQTEEKHLQSLT